MKNHKSRWGKLGTCSLLMAALMTGVLVSSAFAQRAAPDRQQTRADQRARVEAMTPEQRQQYYQQRMQERLKNMTPEQRAQWDARRAQMQQMQRQSQLAAVSGDDRQKYLMQSAGIDDATVQDAILAFVAEQSEKRIPVTAAATGLSNLLADKTATPGAIGDQFKNLQAASKDFRDWKEGALKDLDAKIGYSKDPRLQSLLVLVGIVGDESTDAGGFNAIFPRGLAGGGDIIDLLPKTDNTNGFGFGGGRGGNGGGANPPAGTPATNNAPVADDNAPTAN